MNIQVRIRGEHVGMASDQWCFVIHDDKYAIVVRSCGNPETIWQIKPDWINGVKISERTSLTVKVIQAVSQSDG